MSQNAAKTHENVATSNGKFLLVVEVKVVDLAVAVAVSVRLNFFYSKSTGLLLSYCYC